MLFAFPLRAMSSEELNATNDFFPIQFILSLDRNCKPVGTWTLPVMQIVLVFFPEVVSFVLIVMIWTG